MTGETSYRVGAATVTRIVDLILDDFPRSRLLPDSGASAERLALSIHSWLVRDRGRTILIDTGAGNGKLRPLAPYFDRLETPYLGRLRAAGVEPEAVDLALLTHLHVDHVGWSTRMASGDGERWVPTFPNARYLFSGREYDYFRDPANETERNRTSFAARRDSLDPIVEAGLAERVAVDGSEAVEGFSFHPTPGHSVDHASIRFRSAGAEALFTGDVMHHPLQVCRPDWNSVFDAFPEQALASRAWALETAARSGALVFSSHFPASSAGRVLAEGSGYRWNFC